MKIFKPRISTDGIQIGLLFGLDFITQTAGDLVIDDKIIVELKSVAALNKVMEAQLLNYLKLSHIKVGYLVNFNTPKLEWKRFVN